jgi:BMFP domain-containing protein YqiC
MQAAAIDQLVFRYLIRSPWLNGHCGCGLQSGLGVMFYLSISRMRATLVAGVVACFLGGAPPLFVLTSPRHDVVRAPRECMHQLKASAHSAGARWRTHSRNQNDMNNFFNDLQGKINQAIESSPAKDIERNVKAMMTQGFSKLDLVTREEFEIQNQVLLKTRAKLELLEQRVAELEARLAEKA